MPVINGYLVVIVASLLAAWLLDLACGLLTVRSLDPELPQEFRGHYDAPDYARSQEYARAKVRLDLVEGPVSLACVLAFLFAGGFNALDAALRSLALPWLATGLLYLGALSFAGSLIALPFAVYDTFVLEERFGFNRTTPGLFVADRLKGWLLSALIGGPIVAAVLAFFKAAGPLAWLWAWAAVTAVMLLLAWIGPTLILPLFNRFTPMEPGELRSSLETYCQGQGYALSGVFVMDGSKRSAKANAFFTGLGRAKRIALFDTLLERLDADEALAVLAHEVGHCRLGHVKGGLALGIAKLGLLLWLMSLFIHAPGLHAAFGMEQPSVYAGLVFFLLLYTPASLVLSSAMAFLQRRWEHQADAFAARTTGDAEAMILALKKLSAGNLANLTPHPLDVALHHSHPPALQRIQALRRLASEQRT